MSCNANIKFDKFREHVLHRLGFDCMATGHYARVQQGHELCAPRLLRGVDESKDQSYFLATTAVIVLLYTASCCLVGKDLF